MYLDKKIGGNFMKMKRLLSLLLIAVVALSTPVLAISTSAIGTNVYVSWYNGTEKLKLSERITDSNPVATYNTYIYGVPKREGYQFVGFNTDKDATEALPLKTSLDGKIYYSEEVEVTTSYYAIFKKSSESGKEECKPCIKTYDVKWVNYDGKILCENEKVAPGAKSYFSLYFYGVPEKPSDDKYYYKFIGWSFEPDSRKPLDLDYSLYTFTSLPVHSDVTYYAVYEWIPKCNFDCDKDHKHDCDKDHKHDCDDHKHDCDDHKHDHKHDCDDHKHDRDKKEYYTVKWIVEDKVYDVDYVEKTSIIPYAWYTLGLNNYPTKKADDKFTYEFIGWNTDKNATEALPLKFDGVSYQSEKITGNVNYYAIFKAVPKTPTEPEEPEKPVTYTVRWIIGDYVSDVDTVLKDGLVPYAWYVLGVNAIPTKASDDTYDYVFIGWNTDKDATEALPLKFDGVNYRSDKITADTDYYAIFKAVKKPTKPDTYTVKWVVEGATKDIDTVEAGEHAFYSTKKFGLPVKASDDDYTYEFIGWNTDKDATTALNLNLNKGVYDSGAINADTTFYAIFKAVAKEKENPPTTYTVHWVSNGIVLDTDEVEDGEHAFYSIKKFGIPTKAADENYTYEFIGWNTDKTASTALELTFALGLYDSGVIHADTDFYAIFKAVKKEQPKEEPEEEEPKEEEPKQEEPKEEPKKEEPKKEELSPKTGEVLNSVLALLFVSSVSGLGICGYKSRKKSEEE